MSKHNKQGEPRTKLPGFVCTHCKEEDCEQCVDIMRVIIDLPAICHCKVTGHSGEPINQQILDPETGAVHGPNVVVTAGGEVTFPASITCPKCGRTSHHPEDIKQKYCGNCHQFHDTMGYNG